ncbi:hypothetical protein C8R48DRAFT_672235 [Suillus tomentosus]|nr:hypothetical protein C8R48DRAFT_672235 [Suillus tomentosus]
MANDPGVQIVERFGFDYHEYKLYRWLRPNALNWFILTSVAREDISLQGDIWKEHKDAESTVPSYLSDPPSKRRHDRETQQAVKIRRREEAEAELMARQDLRERFAEPELPPVQGLHHHLPHIVCQVYQIAAAAYREDSAMTYRLSQW